MPKTWTKLESWKPVQKPRGRWWVAKDRRILETDKGRLMTRATRAAALRAANKQNRLEGLPEVQ